MAVLSNGGDFKVFERSSSFRPDKDNHSILAGSKYLEGLDQQYPDKAQQHLNKANGELNGTAGDDVIRHTYLNNQVLTGLQGDATFIRNVKMGPHGHDHLNFKLNDYLYKLDDYLPSYILGGEGYDRLVINVGHSKEKFERGFDRETVFVFRQITEAVGGLEKRDLLDGSGQQGFEIDFKDMSQACLQQQTLTTK